MGDMKRSAALRKQKGTCWLALARLHDGCQRNSSKTRFLRTLHFWLGVWGGEAAPNPHHWGGAQGPKAPAHLPNCKADRCQAKPCLKREMDKQQIRCGCRRIGNLSVPTPIALLREYARAWPQIATSLLLLS